MQKDIIIGREEFILLISDMAKAIGTLSGVELALNTIPIEKINVVSLLGLLEECENTLREVQAKNMENLLTSDVPENE